MTDRQKKHSDGGGGDVKSIEGNKDEQKQKQFPSKEFHLQSFRNLIFKKISLCRGDLPNQEPESEQIKKETTRPLIHICATVNVETKVKTH